MTTTNFERKYRIQINISYISKTIFGRYILINRLMMKSIINIFRDLLFTVFKLVFDSIRPDFDSNCQRHNPVEVFITFSVFLPLYSLSNAMGALYSIPYNVLEVPNLKIKRPSWLQQPSALVMFSIVLASYFLVTGGEIV